MLSFLVSVGLGFGAVNADVLPAASVKAIAEQVIAQTKPSNIPTPTLIVTERPEPTPLGAISYANGKCVIIVNTNRHAWQQWNRFLNEGNRPIWSEIIAASVAHEMGHCMREARSFVANSTISTPALQGLRGTGGLSAPPEMVFKQELFADTVAALYALEHLPDTGTAVIEAMMNGRQAHGNNDPTHNTSSVLNRLMRSDMSRLSDENLGAAAQRLLNQFNKDL